MSSGRDHDYNCSPPMPRRLAARYDSILASQAVVPEFADRTEAWLRGFAFPIWERLHASQGAGEILSLLRGYWFVFRTGLGRRTGATSQVDVGSLATSNCPTWAAQPRRTR